MAHRGLNDSILEFVGSRTLASRPPSAAEITEHLQASRSTVNRHLALLVRSGQLARESTGPATRYRLPASESAPRPSAAQSLVWSPHAASLRSALMQPIAMRTPVTYRREFVEGYLPNQSTLLPANVAADLADAGRAHGQQPAGTYARKVLEQLLIDLSWHSSRLEGNRFSLLDTRELFARGRDGGSDADATMLLNHKEAIEFMVDAVPEQGITVLVIRNLHGLLMQGLLAGPAGVGAIRRKVVQIEDSVYTPSQVPQLLEELLDQIVDKARAIRNPVEAAFFLWVNIAYLQPFEDGNKRTSRLGANLPLLLGNLAPLSFLDVDRDDYTLAMLGVYERLDVSLAADLFAWTYRRSIDKYRVVRESLGEPDPMRVRYRELLGDAVRRVVGGQSLVQVVGALAIPDDDRDTFARMAHEELAHLEPYNCARFRLPIAQVQQWIADGRRGWTNAGNERGGDP